MTFSKGAAASDGQAKRRELPAVDPAPTGGQVAVIPSEFAGLGGRRAGAVLMKGFVFALTQLDELPGRRCSCTTA